MSLLESAKCAFIILAFLITSYGIFYSQKALGEYYMRNLQKQKEREKENKTENTYSEGSTQNGKYKYNLFLFL